MRWSIQLLIARGLLVIALLAAVGAVFLGVSLWGESRSEGWVPIVAGGPLIAIGAFISVLWVRYAIKSHRDTYRRINRLCAHCGYSMVGAKGTQCPECGRNGYKR